MFTVPLVLERIKKAVEVKLKQKSALFQTIFKTVYERKLRKMQLGQSSILLDEIVFRKFKELLGGRVEKILVGGALLNGEIHEFAQVCLCPVLQAYGLTETSAAATTQFPNESATEQVGSVVECCELKLVDWPEGGYRVSDKPNPRGEIWVGGDNVSLGYYQMPEKTKEDFKVIDGVRYFTTGDIGEMDPRGNLKIIDRKKDIVKLQGISHDLYINNKLQN
jgi:long-chain acyl-CoA synthetase